MIISFNPSEEFSTTETGPCWGLGAWPLAWLGDLAGGEEETPWVNIRYTGKGFVLISLHLGLFSEGSACVSFYLWWWVRVLKDWSSMECCCCGWSTQSWQQPSLPFYSFHTATRRTGIVRNTPDFDFWSNGDFLSYYLMQRWSNLPLRSVFRLPKGSWTKHHRSRGTWCTETLFGSEGAVESNPKGKQVNKEPTLLKVFLAL